MDKMESPIILIGMQRSGTTWLGKALSQADDLAYWVEPRQVWSYGNYFLPDDVLTEEHATERNKRYIRKRFAEYTRQHGAERFCEKTPINCLRIRFVHAVYPKAQFIFLIRDGRPVFRSTREAQDINVSWKRIRDRVAESSIREFPALLRALPALSAKFSGKRDRSWGPRPPGWKESVEELTDNQIIARRWADSMEIAIRDMETIADNQKFVLRYEELTTDPISHAEQLVEFLQIRDARSVVDYIRQTTRPARATAWTQELSSACLEEIRPFLEPTLLKLGYAW
jgi:hypothetical protein